MPNYQDLNEVQMNVKENRVFVILDVNALHKNMETSPPQNDRGLGFSHNFISCSYVFICNIMCILCFIYLCMHVCVRACVFVEAHNMCMDVRGQHVGSGH